MLLLGDILRRHARWRPDHLAYVLGDARLTYAAFHRRSNQLAHALRRLGVQHGDRVAVLANNVPEYPIIYFAVLKLGAIAVPLNARFTSAEIGSLLEHSEAAILFVTAELSPRLVPLREGTAMRHLRRVIDIDHELDRLAEAEGGDDVQAAIDEHDPHVMLYTSGTTGAAKGALLSHRSYCLQGQTSHLTSGLTEDDIGLCMFPMFHMGGWAMPLGFWNAGSTVVIMPRAEPRAMLAAIERERVTYFYAVPTVFNSLLALPDFDRFDLRSLRIIASGTSAMTRAQVFEILARFRCPTMFIIYGSTEAGPVSVLRPRDVVRRPETVGRPFSAVDVRLLGADGRDAPTGEAGEIAVRSEFTMGGYWQAAEETARAMVDGWVRTGDLGAFDADGFLSIVGRVKDVIRSGGENIFPAEIERLLLKNPSIAEAAVVGVPDSHWGEAAAAAVILQPGATLTADAVKTYLKSHLAGFKSPKHIYFLEDLPRTAASRQVQKTLLRELLIQRIGQAI